MQDLAPILGHDNEDEQNAESESRYDKKVRRDELFQMIIEKGPPSLRRWFQAANHLLPQPLDCEMLMTILSSSPWILGAPHSGFAFLVDLNSELPRFMNHRFAPPAQGLRVARMKAEHAETNWRESLRFRKKDNSADH